MTLLILIVSAATAYMVYDTRKMVKEAMEDVSDTNLD